MLKFKTHLVPSMLVAAALLTLVGTGTVERHPVIKSFIVNPENTCAARPTNPTVQWDTDGDSVDISVLDPAGNVLAQRAGLPASSGTSTTPFVNLQSANARPGIHKVRLVARLNSGTTTEESRPFRLVGAEGLPYDLSLGSTCEADACDAFGPALYEVKPFELDSTVTFSKLSLTGFTPPMNTTRLFSMAASKAGGGVSMCSGFADCGHLPTVRPIPTAWSQTPQGLYRFEGLSDRVQKQTSFTWTASFALVCR